MADYNAIKGKLVQSLSSDPSITSAYEGQVWYNSTSSLLKSVAHIKATSSGGNLGTARMGLGAAGSSTLTSGLVFGGSTNTPGSTFTNATEEYNGASWSEQNNLGTARKYGAGFGTQTAAVYAGGSDYPNAPSDVEEYDGSSWSEVNNLPAYSRAQGTAGTLTAGLVFGGDPGTPIRVQTLEYDGTNWTAGNNLNTGRKYLAGCGTQTAAIGGGGNEGTPGTSSATEEYNGTSWTSVNSFNNGRRALTMMGSQDHNIIAGGQTSTTAIEEYDGTNWTTIPATLSTGRRYLASFGASTQGAISGGKNGTVYNNTEEYNSNINVIVNAAWASGGAAPRGHAGQSMAGNHTDAMMWGGDTGGGYPGWTTTSHSYNGSSWSSEGSIPTGVSAGGQAGAGHTDAITWGGYKPSPNAATINKTYEYNGSSWTAGGDLNDNREYAYATGAGPQTACIAIGSGPGNSAEHENYNGTAWSEETDFPSGSNFVGTIGTQTATLGVSGSNGTTATWDGSSWTASPNTMNTARSYGAAGGASSSEGYMWGGGPTDHRTFTEKFDGTSWTSDVSMANGRNSAGGSGVTSNSLIAGSYYPGNTAIEEYTAASSTLTASKITTS